MAKKFKKRAKKRIIKKRKTKNYIQKKSNGAAIDLQKDVDFKFQTLGKIYKKFTEKREKEKEKKVKLSTEESIENKNKVEDEEEEEEEDIDDSIESIPFISEPVKKKRTRSSK